MDAPQFSIIIPAYNEAQRIGPTLDAVNIACQTYTNDPHRVEILVVDNGSEDTTASIAAEKGSRVVQEERRVIGAVRNRGASQALGRVLLFVDADTLIHPDTLVAVDRAIASRKFIAGATGVTMDRFSPGIAVSFALLVPVVWLSRMDTGAVFCRHDDFIAIGGYDDTRLYAEDVDLLLRFRRLGRVKKQRLARLRGVKAVTSSRKFDEHGDWHFIKLIAMFVFSQLVSAKQLDRFAAKYWYGDQRRDSQTTKQSR